MAQIVGLYEPGVGTPWYFVLFQIFFLLVTLVLPILIRFAVLRRPIINLWSAILSAFICGFLIALFANIVDINTLWLAIPQSGQVYLLAASFVYSYWIMHTGYRDYCIKKSMETDVKRQEGRQ